MKLLKNISLFCFVFFCSVSATPLFAAEISPTAIIVVDTSIQNAKIVSKDNNVFNLSFSITNRKGNQAGLIYGVKLLKETSKGQFIADEYMYDEVISLNENTTVNKNITYTAPNNLNGEYILLLTLKNQSGISVSYNNLGKITLVSSLKSIEILEDTCFLTVANEKPVVKYNFSQGVDISPKETLKMNCSVINRSNQAIKAIPIYETHYRSPSGKIVEQTGGDISSVSFKAGEKKVVTLSLPKAKDPQAYDVKIYFKVDEVNSNSIFIHYVLRGPSATINNLALDKKSYKKGETANLSFFWSPSADNFPGSRLGVTKMSNLKVNITMTGDEAKACINPINQVLTKSLTNYSASIIQNCKNATVNISILDENGNILDQKSLFFATVNTNENIFSSKKNIAIAFGILVVLGFAGYFINLRKKNESNN